MARRSRFSRAQFIVLFTLALPVLVAVIGFGADFAILYLNWANLQKAADSAALAGAEYLITNPPPPTPPPTAASCPAYTAGDTVSGPKSVSCTYSVLNGAKEPEWSANVGTDGSGNPTLQVILDRPDVPTYFLRLVGVDSLGAKAQATASIQYANCAEVFPIALDCSGSPCNQSNLNIKFDVKFVDGLASGNWDWANVGQGTGAQELASAIAAGQTSQYCIGDTISTSPGHKQSSGVVNNGLQDLLKTCKAYNNTSVYDPCGTGPNDGASAIGNGTDQIPSTDPCIITIPTMNYNGCTGACTGSVNGLVSIYLEQDSTASNINGCFVKALNLTASGGSSGSNLGTLAPPRLID